MASTIPLASIANVHRLFILNAVDELITQLEDTDHNNESSPASKASIDALTSVQLTEECAICLDDQHEKEGREMPCKHKFHKKCVEKWLKMNGNCPICRYRMPEEEKSSADDDKSTVGSDEEVRARVTIVFVGARRLGSHEADEQEEEDM